LIDVLYFEADGYLAKIHLKDGKTEMIEKSLNRLMQILPEYFHRVHRSFIVDIREMAYYRHKGSGVYELVLKNNVPIPLSPNVYKELQNMGDRK
jgi:two-component system, LytTR family, response regulator LytT